MKTIIRKNCLFAAWHVTYNCNLRCKFCDFYTRDCDQQLSPVEIGDGFRKLIPLGVRVVNFAGGEPFVRNDLHEIIASVSKDANVIINSNGTLIDAQKARACWEAGMDVINISIDFASPQKHDFFRNKVGSWEKAFGAVETLTDQRTSKRQIVTVQSIYSAQNHGEIEELIRLCQDRQVTFATNPYHPGDGHEVNDWQPISDKQKTGLAAEMSQNLRRLKEKYPKTFLISDYALKYTFKFLEEGLVENCCAGRYMLAVTPSGEILPCERKEKNSIGNIKDIDSEDIARRLLKLSKNLTCAQCYARERSEIEYIYQPLNLKTILYLLAEAKT